MATGSELSDTAVHLEFDLERSHLQVAQALSHRYLCALATKRAWLPMLANIVLWALIATSLMFVLAALKTAAEPLRAPAWLGLAGLLLAGCLAYAAEVARARRMNLRLVNLQGPFPLRVQLGIDASGITARSLHGEGRYPARSYVAVVESGAALVLLLRSGLAMPIPDAAFMSAEQRQTVRQLLSPAPSDA
jgi:hypothetical protein